MSIKFFFKNLDQKLLHLTNFLKTPYKGLLDIAICVRSLTTPIDEIRFLYWLLYFPKRLIVFSISM